MTLTKMKITRPTFIISEKNCRNNIRQIVDKARRNKLTFRPHFKTHQSAEIGNWFKEEGVNKITVSSVEMAEYFANSGWEDILIAFPVNLLEIKIINNLSSKVNLSLLVESTVSAKFLVQNLKYKVGVYLKIDTGYHRTGIQSGDFDSVEKILNTIKVSTNLTFKGYLTHAGHTYDCKSIEEINRTHNNSLNQLESIRDYFINDFPVAIISIGDTPSCSVVENFNGADEIRPGNFVFYDVMQFQLGSCSIDDIAVVVACPVVAKHIDRNELVIYGGAVHLSKDYIMDNKKRKVFGMVVKLNQNGWSKPLPNCFVSNMSQEHGIITMPINLIDEFEIGDLIGILPVHSCLTANLAKLYSTLDGRLITKMN